MSDPNRDPIIALADALRAYFQGIRLEVSVGHVGHKEYFRQDNASPSGAGRILIVEPPDGDRGELKRGRRAANPDTNLELDRPFKLVVWGVDNGDTSDEQLQKSACWALLEIVFQAVRRAVDPVSKQPFGFANFHFGRVKEVGSNRTDTYGVELQVDVTLKTVFFDVEYATGTASAAIAGAFVPTAPTPLSPPPAIPNLTGGN